jgi:hypothetical protein
MRNLKVFFGLIVILTVVNCKNDSQFDPIPDLKGVPVEPKIKRFDLDMMKVDTLHLENSVEVLKEDYPDFFPLYFKRIMSPPGDSVAATTTIKQFLTVPILISLRDTVKKVFPKIGGKDWTLSTTLYAHYFPKRKAPTFVTFISEFGIQNFTFNDTLVGIGLDYFLGEGYSQYKGDMFPEYLKKTFNPNYVLPKAWEAFITNSVVPSNTSGKLLDVMITNGKIAYILEKLIPREPKERLFGYSSDQFNWCEKNEREMWSFFLTEKMLYSTDVRKYRKFVDQGPSSSPEMPQESPGKTGNYIGWKIVRAYMKKFPTTSLEELVNLTDGQEMLEKAKYKP